MDPDIPDELERISVKYSSMVLGIRDGRSAKYKIEQQHPPYWTRFDFAYTKKFSPLPHIRLITFYEF